MGNGINVACPPVVGNDKLVTSPAPSSCQREGLRVEFLGLTGTILALTLIRLGLTGSIVTLTLMVLAFTLSVRG